VTDEKIPRHITQAWGQFKVSEKPLWQHDCPNSIAVAVTKNAVVIADASQVTALELRSGKQLWSQTLPSAPVPWGMAVDGAGRVTLTLLDGQVLCIGRRLERVVKQRSVQTGHHDPRPDVPDSVESISCSNNTNHAKEVRLSALPVEPWLWHSWVDCRLHHCINKS